MTKKVTKVVELYLLDGILDVERKVLVFGAVFGGEVEKGCTFMTLSVDILRKGGSGKRGSVEKSYFLIILE